MKKQILRGEFLRRAACAILCVLLVCIIAMPASAKAISGSSTITNWSALNYDYTVDSISGSVTAADVGDGTASLTIKAQGKNGVISLFSQTSTTTLTLTNPSTELDVYVTLYEKDHSSNAAKVNDSTAPTDAKQYIIAKGGSNKLTIKLVSTKDATEQEAVIIITEIKLEEKSYTTKFDTYAGGTYTISGGKDDVNETPGNSYTKTTQEPAYTLTAVPDAGYKFAFWVSTADGMLSRSTDLEYSPTKNDTIYPVFYEENAALYQIVGSGTYYQYFDEVMAAATTADGTTKTVKLVAPGSAKGKPDANGNSVTDFTIPANVDFLIPYSDTDTGNFTGKSALLDSSTSASAYANGTLTLPAGNTITVNGEVNVNAQRRSTQAKTNGRVVGKYGLLKLESGSSLVLESGAKLHCFGYIIGSGTVEAKGGSTVYELLQIADWRGGNRTSDWAGWSKGDGKAPLVFNQYYIQNIEANYKIHSGSTTWADAYVEANSEAYYTSIELIGSNGLFSVSNGYLNRSYNATADRMTYAITGTGAVNKMVIDVEITTVDSSQYVMPLTSNMTIEVKPNSTLTVGYDYKLLPEAEVYVHETGELILDGNLYLFGIDEWVNTDYGYACAAKVKPINYIATTGKASTRDITADSGNAKMTVNGTVTVNGGLYTTGSAGSTTDPEKIITGNGIIVNNSKNTNTSIYEIGGYQTTDWSGDTVWELELDTINVQPAVALLAGDSQSTTDVKNIGTATYTGLGEDYDHFWYQNTVAITGAVDQLTSYNGGQFTLNDDGTATGYSITGGTFRFALPFEYVPSVGGTALEGAPIEGTLLMGYEVAVNDNSTVIAIAENSAEPNVTIHMINGETKEEITTQNKYIPAGVTVTGYYSNAACTTVAPAITDGADIYQLVTAKIVSADDTEVYYTTLTDALNAEMEATDTVYLLTNQTVAEAIVIPSGASVNLNLNDKTIANTSDSTAISVITVSAGGKLGICGTGSIVNNVAGDFSAISNSGELTAITGNVTITSAGKYGIYSAADSKIGTIGGAGGVISITAATDSASYGLYLAGSNTLELIGSETGTDGGANVTITGYTNGIYASDATIGKIGNNGDTVTIPAASTATAAAVSLTGGSLEQLGGVNSTVKIGFINDSNTDNSYGLKGFYASGVTIGTIGGDGSSISIGAKNYALHLVGGTTVTNLGVGNDIVDIVHRTANANYTALKMEGASVITNVGGDKSSITFRGNRNAIILSGENTEITNLGCAGSTVTIHTIASSNASVSMTVGSGAKIVNLGAGGMITVTESSKRIHKFLSVSGEITNIGNGGTVNMTGASPSASYIGTAIDITATGIVGNIATPNSTVIIKDTNATYGNGIVIAEGGSITGTVGADGSHVEIVVAQNDISNAGTINDLGAGLIVVSKATGNYAVSNSGTITTVSGGSYYAYDGRDSIFSTGVDAQNYAEGMSLSSTTKSVTLADNTTSYDCYYIYDPSAHVCTPEEAVTENEVAATCTEDGSYDSVVYCSECDKEISRETIVISAQGHTEDEAVTENEKAADFGVEGSYDTVVYCAVCDAELSRETVTTPALVAVAEISGTKYASLEAAIEAAQSTDVVKLLRDVAPDATISIDSGKTVQLDLNGKKITYTGSAFSISGTLNLNLNGGTITNNGVAGVTAAIEINAGGVANIDTTGGSIIVDDAAQTSASKGCAINNKGTLTLTGTGVVKSNAIYNSKPSSSTTYTSTVYNTGTITLIEDVTIEGAHVALCNYGTITTITGKTTITSTGVFGLVLEKGASVGIISPAAGDTVTIHGGSTSATNASALYMREANTINTIGGEGTVLIDGYQYGILLKKSDCEVSSIGVAGGKVEVIGGTNFAISNAGTIGELGSGATLITKESNTAAVSGGTVTTISGGNYYAGGGSTVFTGTVGYASGLGLSADTRKVTLSDNNTVYNCYFITPEDAGNNIVFEAISVRAEGETVLNLKFHIPQNILDAGGSVTVEEEDCGINPNEDRNWTVDFGSLNSLEKAGKLPANEQVKLDDNGRFVFSQGIAAGEMTSKVTVTFKDANDNVIQVYDSSSANEGKLENSVTRTVLDYTALAFSQTDDSYDALQEMCRAMLTYGGYAQAFYGVDTGNPAYAQLKDYGLDLTGDVEASEIAAAVTTEGTLSGVQPNRIMLNLDSKTTMRIYFELKDRTTEGLSVEVNVPVNGKPVPTVLEIYTDETGFYVEIEDIPVAYWDHAYEITISHTDGTLVVTSSVLAWVKSCILSNADAEEVAMAKAMYHYNQAANAYFGK